MFNSACMRLRACFCYFTTTTIISIVIYLSMFQYLKNITHIEKLEEDLKEIYNKFGHFQDDNSNDGGQIKQSILSSRDDKNLEQSFTEQTEKIWQEIGVLKKNLGGCRCCGTNNIPATQIGRTDFASESLGSRIESVDDEPYCAGNFLLSLLGIRTLSNEPRNVLNPSILPGSCYAFRGNRSNIVIRIRKKILIDSVAIEHILDSISPEGHVISAPKDFEVYGMVKPNDPNPYHFGTFSYNIYIRQQVQIFTLARIPPNSYELIQFRFISNSGHPNYTCIYRISIFGNLENST